MAGDGRPSDWFNRDALIEGDTTREDSRTRRAAPHWPVRRGR
jgi:hypothetical protein